MDRFKEAGIFLDQLVSSFRPFTQTVVAFFMGVVAHIDTCASIIAVAVLLFQLKVIYYKGKREKMAYDKECKGEIE